VGHGVANAVINIRNGQRLSVDDYGWLMHGFSVGILSVAPTAAMGFAGYRWKHGGKGPGGPGRHSGRGVQSVVSQ
jgi:hypothetical protein